MIARPCVKSPLDRAGLVKGDMRKRGKIRSGADPGPRAPGKEVQRLIVDPTARRDPFINRPGIVFTRGADDDDAVFPSVTHGVMLINGPVHRRTFCRGYRAIERLAKFGMVDQQPCQSGDQIGVVRHVPDCGVKPVVRHSAASLA